MFFRLLLIAVLLAVSACSSKAPGPGASVPKVVRGEYRVKRGDTLYSIATRHGWNYKDLARANGIRPPYAVKVGQVVRFDGRKSTYVASSRSSSSSRARKPPPPPPSGEPEPSQGEDGAGGAGGAEVLWYTLTS